MIRVLPLGLVFLVVACGAEVADAPPSAAPPTHCAIHRLPLPKGMAGATVGAASPDGRTIAGYASPQYARTGTGVLWRDGEIAATPAFPGEVADLNDHGDVAGNAGDPADKHPWVYSNGKVRDLSGGTVLAIGEDGTLVGSSLLPTPNGPPVPVPARWSPGAPEPAALPVSGKETGQAADITEDGTIVGGYGGVPYAWFHGDPGTPLKSPGDTPAGSRVELFRANGSWAVGSNGSGGVVRWYLGEGAADRDPEVVAGLKGSPGTDGGGLAINASGTVAMSEVYTVKLAGGGQVVSLPSLGPTYLSYPTAISADAKVISGTTVSNQNPGSGSPYLPIYWTCTP